MSPTSARFVKKRSDCRKNEVFKNSSCDETCKGRAVKCLREHKGCFCKPGWVRKSKNNSCILKTRCANQTTTTSTTEKTTTIASFSCPKCKQDCLEAPQKLVGNYTGNQCECSVCQTDLECSEQCQEIYQISGRCKSLNGECSCH